LEQPSEKQGLEMVFNQEEIKCLEQLNKKVEGRIKRQQNRSQKHELGYGAWIIARLGGWKGSASQCPSGVIDKTRVPKVWNYFNWLLFDLCINSSRIFL
jgi:hypothetical protein